MSEARRYRLIETLGKGAFGTVYRAEIIGPGGFAKQVALKVLNRDERIPAEMALRLRDEARILGLIRHRAVVGVDSLADFGDAWGVVMEYVAGVDLALAAHHARMPVRVALEVVEEVASALHAAWAVPSEVTGQPLRLVHRDIKLSNLRLTDQGEVKVLDFGVARADFAQREAATRSLLFGSMRYMAPERLDGVDGHEADVYALGVVLAELLAGDSFDEPPKNPARHRAWLDEVLADLRRSVALGKRPEDTPDFEPLVRLVSEMLAFEPGERPSAREVERRARALRADHPGPYLREWAEVEVPRLIQHAPHRQLLEGTPSILVERSGSVAIHSELAATAEFATEAVQRPESDVVAAPAPTRRRPVGLYAVALVAGIAALGVGIWAATRPGPGQPVATHEVAVPSPAPQPETEPAPAQEAVEPTPISVPVAAPAPAPAERPTTTTPPSTPAPPPSAPPSAAAAPRQAVVSVTGDARSVWLEGPAGSFPAGAVPPGTYTIKAWFDSPDPAHAGTITVAEGEHATLACVAAMLQCRRR
ncbi:MAG: serine/threonine-protein kinase [Pseudomonadota bacterium]